MRAILFWLLLIVMPCIAQEGAASQKFERPPFILKTAPLNLINPFQGTVDVIADIPFADRWSLELGVDVVINSNFYARFKDETYKGVKLKPALKYYIKRTKKGYNYICLAFKYNNIVNAPMNSPGGTKPILFGFCRIA